MSELGDNEKNSAHLTIKEKAQCHVQVDRRRLEALLLIQLRDDAAGQTNAAERFFRAVRC